ncbi:MAG: hypothetical protein WDM80_18770 [Limisphaerales bacterium]
MDLYRHQLDFESPNNIYDETRTGARVSLTRALWSDFFIGSVYYNLENVGISLNEPYYVVATPTIPPVYYPSTNTPSAFIIRLAAIRSAVSARRSPTTRGTARNCPITASARK